MARFIHAVELAPSRRAGQDRASVVAIEGGLVIALADGAGGTGNGEVAAQTVIDAATVTHGSGWGELLAALDGDPRRLGHGQATAVVMSVTAGGLDGASVGDSGAWLVGATEIIDLTEGQRRKSLLGGGCTPVAFHAGPLGEATLLVASDGLLRYAKRADLARVARGPDLAAAARALVDLVRLPTGGLQDDVSIVLCRELG